MKKVIGYIMIVLLFAGSIAGIYFGIKYNGVKNDKANIDKIKKVKKNLRILSVITWQNIKFPSILPLLMRSQ